jgi:hypothetical protein
MSYFVNITVCDCRCGQLLIPVSDTGITDDRRSQSP